MAIENSMKLILTSFIIIVGILIAHLFKVLDEDFFPQYSKGELETINLTRILGLFLGIIILITFLIIIFKTFNKRRLRIIILIEKNFMDENFRIRNGLFELRKIDNFRNIREFLFGCKEDYEKL